MMLFYDKLINDQNSFFSQFFPRYKTFITACDYRIYTLQFVERIHFLYDHHSSCLYIISSLPHHTQEEFVFSQYLNRFYLQSIVELYPVSVTTSFQQYRFGVQKSKFRNGYFTKSLYYTILFCYSKQDTVNFSDMVMIQSEKRPFGNGIKLVSKLVRD